ncbi:MAG: complex I NDUFA9 subunit family protein [Hyphomonadaceae bacterium]|nr:complex I NDUFA9 subunit family protein [Hyphomonadaceae bacterium]
MAKGLVTLIGGSGFIGRYAAHALVRAGWRVRVACRRPNLAQDVKVAGPPGWVDLVQANIRNPASLARAMDGADIVVNLVGILYEAGKQSFETTQDEGARAVAQAAQAAGVSRLVHMSAIGADADSKASYARTKAAGEAAVREVFPEAVILRPSIVFGPEDEFFNKFASMACWPILHFVPIMPLIGGGKTRFQPVYAGDVADAILAAATREDAAGKTYELGGPRSYSFKQLYDFIFETTDRQRLKLPVPFFAAKPFAMLVGLAFRIPLTRLVFGAPPITGDQVDMLRSDNLVSENALTLADLGVTDLESVESIVPTYLWRFRPYGEFHKRENA